MNNKFFFSLLTMFGIGYYKKAPGTLASFVTCLIYYILLSNLMPFTISLGVFCFILFFLFIVTIGLIDKYSKNFKEEDPREIVIDEFLGQSIPIIFLSFFSLPYGYWKGLVLGWEKLNYPLTEPSFIFLLLISFILFRFFDILKPSIIYHVQYMRYPYGIIMDDIVSGIFTIVIVASIVLL